MRIGAVVVAAGSGSRFGGEVPKQFLEVAGRPVLAHALEPFLAHPSVASISVVIAPDVADAPPAWLAELPVTLCRGGARRGDSVLRGLRALSDTCDRVLIHDGARPLVTPPLIDRVAGAVGSGGAIAAVPVRDTLQRVEDGRVVDTVDRSSLWHAQTPQGFPRAGIVTAYERADREGWGATDDAAVFIRAGGEVRIVEGDEANLKLTRPADLRIVEVLLRSTDRRIRP